MNNGRFYMSVQAMLLQILKFRVQNILFMHSRSVSITKIISFFTIIILSPVLLKAQGAIEWTKDGNGYTRVEQGEIVQYALPQKTKTVLVSKAQLTPAGQSALQVS